MLRFAHLFFGRILPLNPIVGTPFWTSDRISTECTRILSEVSSHFRGGFSQWITIQGVRSFEFATIHLVFMQFIMFHHPTLTNPRKKPREKAGKWMEHLRNKMLRELWVQPSGGLETPYDLQLISPTFSIHLAQQSPNQHPFSNRFTGRECPRNYVQRAKAMEASIPCWRVQTSQRFMLYSTPTQSCRVTVVEDPPVTNKLLG